MKVKIKKTHPDAVIPFKNYDSDFAYDVTAVTCEEIAPNVYKYGLGIALQIDRKQVNPFTQIVSKPGFSYRMKPWQLSIDLRPRSSVWKTGMVLSNCEGTVDENYIGEISAIFYHVLPTMPKYEIGDRIGQLKIGFTLPVEFEEVNALTPTDRADGAYGSTGK